MLMCIIRGGNFVAAVLDGGPLSCPIEEAMWTDWVTQQVDASPLIVAEIDHL